MKHFDIGEDDIWWCEATGTQHKFRDLQVHHINGRGKGMDIIENLMSLQPKIHARAHGDINYISKSEFQYIHNSFLAGQRRPFLA